MVILLSTRGTAGSGQWYIRLVERPMAWYYTRGIKTERLLSLNPAQKRRHYRYMPRNEAKLFRDRPIFGIPGLVLCQCQFFTARILLLVVSGRLSNCYHWACMYKIVCRRLQTGPGDVRFQATYILRVIESYLSWTFLIWVQGDINQECLCMTVLRIRWHRIYLIKFQV